MTKSCTTAQLKLIWMWIQQSCKIVIFHKYHKGIVLEICYEKRHANFKFWKCKKITWNRFEKLNKLKYSDFILMMLQNIDYSSQTLINDIYALSAFWTWSHGKAIKLEYIAFVFNINKIVVTNSGFLKKIRNTWLLRINLMLFYNVCKIVLHSLILLHSHKVIIL